MSDARALSIDRAATELVEELLNASSESGGERWFYIIRRKMEQLGECQSGSLRVGGYELRRVGDKVMVARIFRESGVQAGGDGWRETDVWEPKDLAKLRLWLNGEK